MMPNKQAVADVTYTHLKNAIKIAIAIIPGVPSEAKIMEPVLDIVYSNMKWAGLFKTDFTIAQEVEFRKSLKKTFKELTELIPTSKRELLERAKPEIEEMLNENIHGVSSLDITDRIAEVLDRPVHTEGDFFTDKDFYVLTKLFLDKLAKNLDNTEVAGTLLREKVEALYEYIIGKFKENETEHADFLRRLQELELSNNVLLSAKVDNIQSTLDVVVKLLSVIIDSKDKELLKYVSENLPQFETITFDSYCGENTTHILIPVEEIFKKPLSPSIKKLITNRRVRLNYKGIELQRDLISVSNILSQMQDIDS